MWYKKNKIKGFSKKERKNYCYLCKSHTGLVKNTALCRKCLYDYMYLTSYQ